MKSRNTNTESNRGRVNWAKVDTTTEAKIEAQAAEDGEDLTPWTPEMKARVHTFKPRPKQSVTIRIDANILDRLRASGPGYQSRINAILRSYFSM